jgi:EAL domain-containing protein (putative c-di-GMP-specific phosphodiesterase class I)
MLVKAQLAQSLKNALINQEFRLLYQPQYNLHSGRFLGVEALIRWQHPEFGLLSPQHFIDLAEESDEIISIGTWVIHSACRQLKKWHDNGLDLIKIAVNVSSKQFQHPDFIPSLLDALEEFNIAPEFLEIEINENVILHEDQKIIETIHQLKDLGIQIALDDFGTGYSSISHLKKIPIDRIKIDKTFIENISSNQNDAAIVKAIIALAMCLNIQVVAEGVETLHQLKQLLSERCTEAQGFYFSVPLTEFEIENFLSYYASNPFYV